MEQPPPQKSQPLDPLMFGAEQRCFGCSPHHEIGLRLPFAIEGDEVVTRFTPGESYQGPPNILHGGLVMTAADELAAWTLVGLRGLFGFTTSMEARLSRPLRIGIPAEGRGRLIKESSRFTEVEVVFTQDNVLAMKGKFNFAILSESAAEKLLGMPLPEAWKRFCRPPPAKDAVAPRDSLP